MTRAAPSTMARAGRRILILYGSETGSAQDKAEEIDRMCQRLRFHTDLEAMDAAKLNDLLDDYDLVCFVLSTTGQGHFPNNARKFWKSLRRAKLPPNCLASVQFTVFGLGDSTYHRYSWASRLLRSRVLHLGGKEVFARGEADERHDDGIDSIYQPWLKDLQAYLSTTYPLPPSVQPIPEEEPLPPRYTLSLCLPNAQAKPDDEGLARPDTPADFPPPVLLPHPHSICATVVSNTRVTPADHWQDVRLLALDVRFPAAEGADSEPLPGDRVVVYPKNYPRDVQTLIDLMDWSSVADRQVMFGAKRPSGLFPKPDCTLRELLTHNIDFTAVPSRSFLHKLAFYTSHVDQKEKLFELVRPDSSQEFYDFTSRPRRTILEVLAEFHSAKIPFEAVPDVFPIIRGREFSIANGGDHWAKRQVPAAAGPAKANAGSGAVEPKDGNAVVYRFDILAALVEYRTIIRKPRQGLCSRYLKNLPAGTPLHVEMKRETPPPNGRAAAARPLIAIATGTGVAPVRSLIHDRLRYAPRAETLLFFGCRQRTADFHFHEEWDGMANLTVVPAFSRDPPEPEPEPPQQSQGQAERAAEPAPKSGDRAEAPARNGLNGAVTDGAAPALPKYDAGKNYVQHMIRRRAAEVCALLEKNAIICLCGNSGRMPASVREALRDAAVAGGFCKDADEAGARLFDEKDAGRIVYWEETW